MAEIELLGKAMSIYDDKEYCGDGSEDCCKFLKHTANADVSECWAFIKNYHPRKLFLGKGKFKKCKPCKMAWYNEKGFIMGEKWLK
jgi:hypothetical protein